MAPQKVTEKIIDDAQKEARSILNRYKQEAEQIYKTYTEKIKLRRAQIEKEIERLKDTEILRAISQKKLLMNNAIVSKKRELIIEIIKQALKELPAHKQYLSFLKQLIENSGQKNGVLIISESDFKKYGSALKTFFNKKKLSFEIETSKQITGGLIIKKEKTEYLGTIDLISELLGDQLTIAISKKLFSRRN